MPHEAAPPGASGSAALGTVQVCNGAHVANCSATGGFVMLKQGSHSAPFPPRVILRSRELFGVVWVFLMDLPWHSQAVLLLAD